MLILRFLLQILRRPRLTSGMSEKVASAEGEREDGGERGVEGKGGRARKGVRGRGKGGREREEERREREEEKRKREEGGKE